MFKAIGVAVAVGVSFVTVMSAWSLGADALTSGSDVGPLLALLGICLVAGVAVGGMRRAGLFVVLALVASGCTRVEPGWEGIKVDMLGGDRGASYPIVTGRVYYNPYTEDIYQFPTFLQRVTWRLDEAGETDDSFTFRSKEGYAFSVDVGAGVSFKAGKTPVVFKKYRREAEEIINGPFRDTVREAFVQAGSRMEGLSILGPGMSALNADVTGLVRKIWGDMATVDYVNVVGKPRVDAKVEGAINAVIQATQQANEAQERVRLKEAEARQQVAQANGNAEAMLINAKAKADAIRIEAEALRQFGAQVIEMRAIEKWNGTMPLVTGGGSMPFVSLPSK